MTSTITADGRSPARPGRGAGAATRVLVIVVVVLALLAAGAFVARRVVTGSRDHEVVVFGDSITEQAAGPMHQRFDGSFTLSISGVSGARADQRIADASAYAATTPGQVIINLGTNDVLQGTPPDETAASLTQIAEGFRDTHCVHLVTVNESMVDLARPQMREGAVAVNERVRTLAATHGWDVIDWAGIVATSDRAGNPDGPLTLDTVHPTPLGQQRLLDAYAEALQRC
jgi:lysophospholipase L1-like esterase